MFPAFCCLGVGKYSLVLTASVYRLIRIELVGLCFFIDPAIGLSSK